MKKSLIVAGAIFLTSGLAIAKTIDFDTSIKWNSNVVERALNKSGFLGSSDASWDVRVTHERILAELLKMESFSVRDATRVCLDKCNMSDFLKNGRGASGKKCPDLCSSFADMLVSVNNELTKTGTIQKDDTGLVFEQKDGTIKVFSSNKHFYAVIDNTDYDKETGPTITSKYSHICTFEEPDYAYGAVVVYETQNNKPVALLYMVGEDCTGWTHQLCGIGKYAFQGRFDITHHGDCGLGAGESWEFITMEDTYIYRLDSVKTRISKIKSILNTVPHISPNDVEKYLRRDRIDNFTQIVANAENAVKKWETTNFTETSWEKYEELAEIDAFTNKLLEYKDKNTSNLEYNIQQLDKAVKCINQIKGFNGKTNDLTHLYTETPTEAYEKAKDILIGFCYNIVDSSKIKCSGDCKRGISSVGKDDTVTCAIGDITYSVVFDDICQSRIEEAIDIFRITPQKGKYQVKDGVIQ